MVARLDRFDSARSERDRARSAASKARPSAGPSALGRRDLGQSALGRSALRVGLLGALATLALVGCKRGGEEGSSEEDPKASQAELQALSPEPTALSQLDVDHGELDTKAPDASPKLGAIVVAANIYKLPNTESRRLGYIRLGGVVPRDPEPVRGSGCN